MKNQTKTKKVKATRIGKHRAFELMKNSGGGFFTVVFTDKEGEKRKINGKYLENQTLDPLGYVKVKELSKLKTDPENAIRSVNLQIIEELKIKGQVFRIGK